MFFGDSVTTGFGIQSYFDVAKEGGTAEGMRVAGAYPDATETPAEAPAEQPASQSNFTGLANEADKNGDWWYYTNGKIDRNHTSIDKNKYGWWRVENGKVKVDGVTCTIKNGKVVA